MLKITLAFLTTLFFVCCRDKTEKVLTTAITSATLKDTTVDTTKEIYKVKATDYNFFADSVLKGHKEILKYYFTKYSSDACDAEFYDKSELIKNFEGLVNLGNIRKDRTSSVFVLKPLNYCTFDNEKDLDGEAYYFTDTTLPRLKTDSYCCHPSNIFSVGDIDEDGTEEIGQFYSSCTSHYKSLYVYSLKNKSWKEVGHSVYDLNYMDIEKPFTYYVKKKHKGKFEMLEITDLTEDTIKIGKPNWKQFSI